MIGKNLLTFIENGNGDYNLIPVGRLKAQSDYQAVIQFISPRPLENNTFMITYVLSDAINKEISQYLIPTKLKARDVLDEYELIEYDVGEDWVVLRAAVRKEALSNITRFRSGEIGIGFTIKSQYTPDYVTEYKGLFDRLNKPSETANDGEYYKAAEYNLEFNGETYAKGDLAIWYNGQWNKFSGKLIQNTNIVRIPVDPATYGVISYLEDDEMVIDSDLIASISNNYNNIIDRLKETLIIENDGAIDFKNNKFLNVQSINGLTREITGDYQATNKKYVDNLVNISINGISDELQKKANKEDIPHKVSELENDLDFITRDEIPEDQDLSNYYTIDEVDQKIGDIGSILDIINGE